MSQLLVEVVCEELPASAVRPALAALRDGVIGLLDGVAHGAARTYATPRRLAVVIDGVAEGRPVVEKQVAGPPETSAFRDGVPTRVAEGFARGKGVAVGDLVVIDGPRGRVVAATVREGGERTAQLVGEGLDAVIRAVPFRKTMEWGSGGVRWSRPIHRVNAVYAGEPIEGTAVALPIGARTLGHRLVESPDADFHDEATWLAALRARAVEPDLDARKAHVRQLVLDGIASVGGDPDVDEALLEEVTHLVEAPTRVVGAFEPALLGLPHRLLVKAMKAHQRYFPVVRGGELTEHFVVISNNPWGDAARIARGNADVLRARFDDARFFYAEDQKRPLEAHGEQLAKMRWIRGVGTMADKQRRVAALAGALAPLLGADPAAAVRAGQLCKCDLSTLMVGEFPDLQGHMGHLYALAQGEDAAVARAIEEHYQPAGAGEAPPSTREGAALALADRLDTLVGCFGVGMVPKGSGDPQGLRRAMIGAIAIVQDRGLREPLGALFERAFDAYEGATGVAFDRWLAGAGASGAARAACVTELERFAAARFKAHATRGGVSADLVDAVLAVGPSDPVDWQARLDALVAMSGSDGFVPILQTFKRMLNITADSDAPPPERAHLGVDAERALYDAAEHARAQVDAAVVQLDYARAFEVALALATPVAALFDAVLIDDPDPARRAARKGLLRAVADVFRSLADFSRVSTR